MATKGGAQPRGPAIHPYEALRLKQCTRNQARLRELGITTGIPEMSASKKSAITSKKNKPKNKYCEGSESEYDPEQDDTDEENLFDENQDQDSTKNFKKNMNKRTADMPPGGIKARPTKRVLVELQTNRVTRSKTSLTVQDAATNIGSSNSNSITPIDIPVPNSSLGNNGNNIVNAIEALVLCNVPHQPNVNTHMTSGNDSISQICEHNQMANDDCNDGVRPHIDNCTAQHHEESECDIQFEEEGRCNRGVNMGKGLQRLSRARHGKLPVVIPEGRICLIVPLVASKFATECNIAVKNHVHVLKHWKEYKNQPGFLKHFIGKVGAKFDMDISAAPIQMACSQMMKSVLHQQRYRLKKKYFDPYPLHLVQKTSPVKSMMDEQWNGLVERWKNPLKMETCEKNKANRAKVKLHQTTGSRSYVVHLENLGDKYIDEDPNALDLFKECHYSKKTKGYTPSVQSAINEMENKLAEPTESNPNL